MLKKSFSSASSDEKMMHAGGTAGGVFILGNGKLEILSEKVQLHIQEDAGFEKLNGAYLHSVALDEDGNLYFGSGKNIYSFNPSELGRPVPGISLYQVNVNLEPVDIHLSKFNSDQNHISFYFTGIWHQNPKALSFRYRLNDEEYTSTQAGEAIFSNLAAGTYTFEVQSGTMGMFYESNTVKHTFTIAKPIYQQVWFIAFVIALIGCTTALFIHFRIKRLTQKRQVEKEQLQIQLTNLRMQVNPHFLFNSFNTLMNLIETKSEQAADYLQRISDFYRKMLDNDQKQVVTLKAELENLQAYIYLQQKRFGDAIQVEIDLSQEISDSKIPVLTLQLLAENAIKHNIATRSSPLKIYFHEKEKFLCVENRIIPKVQKEPGTGMGLANIKNRYKALFNRKIIVSAEDGIFIVKLPIIQS